MSTTTQQPSAPLGGIDELLSLFFPLVLRARPVCRPLPARIAHVEDVVRQAQQTTPTALLRAAEAHNFAALIASDCGLPDLARNLCIRQYTAIRAAGPGHGRAWETFQLVNNGDGSYSLRAAVNGRYVCAENAGAAALIANRTTIGAWEKFDLVMP